MLCPNCKKEIENGSAFCEYCGTRVKKSKKGLWITLSVIVMAVIATIVVITIQELRVKIASEQYLVEQRQQELEQQLQAERKAREEAERKAELARQREARRQELLSQGYVDLGLPSGTLWRTANEGGNDAHYTYDEAIRIYGHKLPTKQQIEELVNYCSFSFQWGKDVNVVTGPNGMSIKFPAACYEDSNGDCYGAPNGYYWSCTPCTQSSGEAYCFYFYDSPIDIGKIHQFYKLSVRLVAD